MIVRILVVTGLLTVFSSCLHAEQPSWVTLLDGKTPPPASPAGGLPIGPKTVSFENGLLHITDPSREPGSVLMYRVYWHADPRDSTECEGRLKLITASEGPAGMCMDVADGLHEEILSFYPDHIGLWYAKLDYPMNTTDDLHTYRVRISDTDIEVFVDDKLAIDGKGKFSSPAEGGRNEVEFGAGASFASGEALWQTFRFQRRRPMPQKIDVPQIPGLSVRMKDTVVIQPNATYPAVFQFADGRITVGGGSYERDKGYWSADGGHTWKEGPPGPNNASIELRKGEVVSLGFWTKKRGDGKYSLDQKRSLDNWKTVNNGTSIVGVPRSVPCGGDGAETNDGFLMDHGLIRLKNGDLMATMYGNYEGDHSAPADFPESFHFYRYRTIVAFSSDKGKTWGSPVTVAYDADPSLTQEGFDEGALARAPNGDILCVMRSGGSFGKHTPVYLCRSRDEGRSWSKPEPIADRGVWPNLCVMKCGVIVCTYGRPDNYLIFSTNNGKTWKGSFCFYRGRTSSYNSITGVGRDTILVVYDREAEDDKGLPRREIVGTFFTVKKR
ncbi:MAG: exo-alpha-sialidase [Armatimonadetes bacterium]|nr:exo-alpha-sialidase [Armatimonadota bacterium]